MTHAESLRFTGILDQNTPVAPLVNASPAKPVVQQHFSSFPMTAHLHHPVLRLVSLHPLLSLNLSFLRVPEIHDGYDYKFFISRTMTVNDVITSVVEELGLTKTLPIPGGGPLEYVLEEVWWDRGTESMQINIYILSRSLSFLSGISRLPNSSNICNIVAFPFSPNPFSSSARRTYRLCVPDEWYRRSKSRNVSSTSFEPSQSTIRRLAALQESDEEEEEEEDEGTAKRRGDDTVINPPSATDADSRGASRNRLSSMFDGWMISPSEKSHSRSSVVLSPGNRKSIVSEPSLVAHSTGNSLKSTQSDSTPDEDMELDENAFDHMLVSLRQRLNLSLLIRA